jgi:hypothetical protein
MHLNITQQELNDKCIKILRNNNLENSLKLLSKIRVKKQKIPLKDIKHICGDNIDNFINKSKESKQKNFKYNVEFNKHLKILHNFK